MGRPDRQTLGLLAVVVCAVAVYWTQMNTGRFGFYHDDGIYAVTAQALATGQGYRIISLPDQPAQTKYPPLYPFLLSLIWRCFPDFPENLPRLIAFSVMLAALLLAVTYAYLVRLGGVGRGTALVIVILMAFNGRLIWHAGSLFAELPYALLSVLALWAVERYATTDRHGLGVLAGLLLGLAYLTRVIGLTLLLAAVVWLLAKRLPRKLPVVLLCCALLIVPWLIWQRTHRSPAHTPAAAYYTDYTSDFSARVGDIQSLPARVAKNLFYVAVVFVPLVSLSLDYQHSKDARFLPALVCAFALIVLGLVKRCLAGPRLQEVYVIFYLGLLLILPYTEVFDRYILPLLPFLLLYLVTQWRQFLRPRPAPAVGRPLGLVFAVGMLIIALPVVYHFVRVPGIRESEHLYREHARLEQPVLDWVRRNTPPDAVILSYRDPVVFLRTGRRAANSSFMYERGFYAEGQGFDPSQTRFRLDLIEEVRADYLILLASDFAFDFHPEALRQGIEQAMASSPHRFTLMHETSPPFAKIYHLRRADGRAPF